MTGSCPSPSREMRRGRAKYSRVCPCAHCAPLAQAQREAAAILGGTVSQLADWVAEERYVELERLQKTAQQIAWEMGVSRRTVERWRAKRK